MADLESTPEPEGRRQRKRQRMASHLAVTAFELFEEFGYESVTMERIAAEADVAKATLYSYFPVKEALVAHHLKDEMIKGMAARADRLAMHRSFVSRMQFLLRESAAWHASKRSYLPHYLRYLNSIADHAVNDARNETGSKLTLDIMTEMFRAGQRSGEVVETIPPEKLAWSLQYLLYGAVTHWLVCPGEDLSREFLQAFALLMDGVAITRQPAQTSGSPRIKQGKRSGR